MTCDYDQHGLDQAKRDHDHPSSPIPPERPSSCPENPIIPSADGYHHQQPASTPNSSELLPRPATTPSPSSSSSSQPVHQVHPQPQTDVVGLDQPSIVRPITSTKRSNLSPPQPSSSYQHPTKKFKTSFYPHLPNLSPPTSIPTSNDHPSRTSSQLPPSSPIPLDFNRPRITTPSPHPIHHGPLPKSPQITPSPSRPAFTPRLALSNHPTNDPLSPSKHLTQLTTSKRSIHPSVLLIPILEKPRSTSYRHSRCRSEPIPSSIHITTHPSYPSSQPIRKIRSLPNLAQLSIRMSIKALDPDLFHSTLSNLRFTHKTLSVQIHPRVHRSSSSSPGLRRRSFPTPSSPPQSSPNRSLPLLPRYSSPSSPHGLQPIDRSNPPSDSNLPKPSPKSTSKLCSSPKLAPGPQSVKSPSKLSQILSPISRSKSKDQNPVHPIDQPLVLASQPIKSSQASNEPIRLTRLSKRLQALKASPAMMKLSNASPSINPTSSSSTTTTTTTATKKTTTTTILPITSTIAPPPLLPNPPRSAFEAPPENRPRARREITNNDQSMATNSKPGLVRPVNENRSKPQRVESDQVKLSKLTERQTRLNKKRLSIIKVEEIQMGRPRPPSPEGRFRKTSGRTHVHQDGSEGRKRNYGAVTLNDQDLEDYYFGQKPRRDSIEEIQVKLIDHREDNSSGVDQINLSGCLKDRTNDQPLPDLSPHECEFKREFENPEFNGSNQNYDQRKMMMKKKKNVTWNESYLAIDLEDSFVRLHNRHQRSPTFFDRRRHSILPFLDRSTRQTSDRIDISTNSYHHKPILKKNFKRLETEETEGQEHQIGVETKEEEGINQNNRKKEEAGGGEGNDDTKEEEGQRRGRRGRRKKQIGQEEEEEEEEQEEQEEASSNSNISNSNSNISSSNSNVSSSHNISSDKIIYHLDKFGNLIIQSSIDLNSNDNKGQSHQEMQSSSKPQPQPHQQQRYHDLNLEPEFIKVSRRIWSL